jgi:hypothetical protein
MCLPLGKRAFLIVSHEATVPGNIGCKNGRKPSHHLFPGQATSPVSSKDVVMMVAWWWVKEEAQRKAGLKKAEQDDKGISA